MLNISLCNFTKYADEEVGKAVRAINRQIAEDFVPHWHWASRVRLEGRSANQSGQGIKQAPQDLRGDAIIYLWDKVADVPNALGYHDQNNRGLPYGFVFTEISDRLDEPWSVTLSHEVLELIGDANANVLAAGPHPEQPNKMVFHWYEMCDAVQAETYEIDGVKVSNFVLPLYFTIGEQIGARNDFLNRVHGGKSLTSFGINPGGYVGFFNPETGQQETFSQKNDSRASKRMDVKGQAFSDPRTNRARRSALYKQLSARATAKL